MELRRRINGVLKIWQKRFLNLKFNRFWERGCLKSRLLFRHPPSLYFFQPQLILFDFIVPLNFFSGSHFKRFIQKRDFRYPLIGQQFFIHNVYNRCHPFICGAVAGR